MTEEEKKINDEESAYLEEQLADIDVDSIQLTPAIPSYSHQRVRRYLASEGIDMRTVCGYKYYRYRPCREYQLYDMTTGKIMYDGYKFTLYQLRKAMASLNLPLKEERPTGSNKRNKGCLVFLNAVKEVERAKQGGLPNG